MVVYFSLLQDCPKDQLLIFNLDDGWPPLCQFLGRPIPAHRPFPHLNRNGTLMRTLADHQVVKQMAREANILVMTSFCVLSFVTYRLVVTSSGHWNVVAALRHACGAFFGYH